MHARRAARLRRGTKAPDALGPGRTPTVSPMQCPHRACEHAALGRYRCASRICTALWSTLCLQRLRDNHASFRLPHSRGNLLLPPTEGVLPHTSSRYSPEEPSGATCSRCATTLDVCCRKPLGQSKKSIADILLVFLDRLTQVQLEDGIVAVGGLVEGARRMDRAPSNVHPIAASTGGQYSCPPSSVSVWSVYTPSGSFRCCSSRKATSITHSSAVRKSWR